MSIASKKHSIIYFQPGQVLFVAQGNLQDVPGKIQELIDWAKEIAASKGDLSAASDVFDFNPLKIPSRKKRRVLSKSKSNAPSLGVAQQTELPSHRGESYESPQVRIPPPFSLVFTNFKSNKWPEFPKEDKPEDQAQALNELLDLTILLDSRRNEAPVKLEVVSPNWLMSAGPEPGGTGGPGSMPKYVNITSTNIPNFIVPATPQIFGATSQSAGGNDVVVAILDTAYDDQRRVDIYDKWVINAQQPHPIIESLLGKSRRLQVHLDPTVATYLPGVMIDGHNYDMTDHGLFVAGIINSLAPKAELHLYQVLNQYGLGDLNSIARALDKIINAFQGRPLVVNLSLTMNMPLEKRHLKILDDFGMGRAILNRKPWWLARLVSWLFNWLFGKPLLCCCDSWSERQAIPFEWICDLIYSLDSRVIAAAGNDAKKGHTRPSALYPAAFERVFGVGALGSGNSPASYSNLADIPPRKGLTTFGGDEVRGIHGVYVGEFPDARVNDTGWASWSGTSFATPIISGLTASVLSDLIVASSSTAPQPTTEDAIQRLYDAQLNRTPDGEDVLDVSQS